MKERMKKVTALCLAAALSVGTVLPVHAETVQDAQNAVDQLQQQKDSVQAEKTTVETELKKIAEEMEKTQSKLDAKQAEITEAEENLVQAKVEENTQYQSMKIRIKYMYENGNMEFIEVLADSENISDFLNKTEYISKLSEYDRDKLKEFQKTVKAVEEQEAALQKEYEELNTLQTDLVNQQTQAQTLLKEKDVQLADLSSQLGSKMETLQKLVDLVTLMVQHWGGSEQELAQMMEVKTNPGMMTSLTLPDGTLVFLNSESTLSYPSRFDSDTRNVTLQGEAYFEVSHSDKPFEVHGGGQCVRVLGTSFNVMSYMDETFAHTTLKTGKVEVTTREQEKVVLTPGRQAYYSERGVNVREVDVEVYIAWMGNTFKFDKENIDVILRKIARWYNVHIFYMNENLKNYHFKGTKKLRPKYEINKNQISTCK